MNRKQQHYVERVLDSNNETKATVYIRDDSFIVIKTATITKGHCECGHRISAVEDECNDGELTRHVNGKQHATDLTPFDVMNVNYYGPM